MWTIAALGGLAVILGTVQVASAGQAGHFYQTTHRGWVTGFFANRNAAGNHFLIALLALAALHMSENQHGGPGARHFVTVLLAMALVAGTVMTGSRASIGLLLIIVIPAAAYAVARRAAHGAVAPGRILRVGAPVGLLVLAGAAFYGWSMGGLRSVAARFGGRGDVRFDIWEDTRHAIGTFWPTGSGPGTFQTAFAGSQRLETIERAAVNRAHNDYLELLLEGGAVSCVALAAIALVTGRAAFQRWRIGGAGRERAHVVFAIAALVVIGLHSIVDYPVRTLALAAMAGLAAGILVKREDVS